MQISSIKSQISKVTKNPLFSGSIILMVGSTLANLINYLYHLILGRLLGPSNYGELASLISLSGLLAVFPISFSLAVIKYVSASKTKEDKVVLISWLKRKILQLSIVFSILLALISPLIRSFLHINNVEYIFAIALSFIFSLSGFYSRSILQGLLKFKETIISLLVENTTKLVFSVLLVYLGYQVGGAMVAFIISAVIGWYTGNIYLKSYEEKKVNMPSNIKTISLYSIPIVVQSIALTSLYSSDLVLVKHFFSSHDAGIYAAFSTLGKIIYFGAAPIGAVMFPLVSQTYSSGRDYRKIFLYSFITTLALAVSILIAYWLFPQFAIRLLYGEAYLEAANLLFWFGIFIALFTLSSLIINLHLSVGRTKVVVLPVLASAAQILAIWFYHNSLFDVIIISVSITALLLGLLLLYSSYYEKKFSFNKPHFGNSPNI